MTQNAKPFNPNEHLMQLKSREGSKDYLAVQWRLVWFRSMCPEGTIDTEEIFDDPDKEFEAETFVWNAEKRKSEKVTKRAKGWAKYKAVVTDGRGGRATGHKTEKGVDFSDYAEKAETGSVGRALAMLGYGTQFAAELSEEHRIVDAPVQRTSSPATGSSAVEPVHQPSAPITSGTQQPPLDGTVTEQQITSIRKLCTHLGKTLTPEPTTYDEAKAVIAQLSQEYRQSRKTS